MSHSIDTLNKILIDTSSTEYIKIKMTDLQSAISKSDSNISIWIPIFSSIVGGLLVWTGQSFERRHRRNEDDKKIRLEIYSYCRALEATMKNNYRELAMAKTHVEYWWYCYNTSNPSNNTKYYDEHLKSQSFAREIERRIGDTKAEFIGHVRKFQAIKKLPSDIEDRLNSISDLTHQKAKTYDTSINKEKIRFEMVEIDEENLRNEYYKNLTQFKIINDNLMTLVK